LSDDGLNHTDLAVLERYADPQALLAAGSGRLTRLIATTSRGQLGQAKTQALRTAAAEAVALWEGESAIAIQDLAAEVASEVRLVRAAEAERARHEHARDAAMVHVDPAGLAASLPGLGPVGTTQLVATMGRPGRFPNGGAFKAFTGLVPRANETGQTDRKHQPMTKAGPRALRSQLVQSANTARKLDPQLAAVYHAQMTQRGATHRKALCVVAARLAERDWLTLWTSPLRQDTSAERRMSGWKTANEGTGASSPPSSSATRSSWSAPAAAPSLTSPATLGSTTPPWGTGCARTPSTAASARG
jgi:transposase